MLLNYIYYRDGKIHYNTLASFYKNNKWLFTDVLKDVYELEDENCAQFVYDDYEGYYGIVVKATDTNIEVLKILLFQHIQNHIL